MYPESTGIPVSRESRHKTSRICAWHGPLSHFALLSSRPARLRLAGLFLQKPQDITKICIPGINLNSGLQQFLNPRTIARIGQRCCPAGRHEQEYGRERHQDSRCSHDTSGAQTPTGSRLCIHSPPEDHVFPHGVVDQQGRDEVRDEGICRAHAKATDQPAHDRRADRNTDP